MSPADNLLIIAERIREVIEHQRGKTLDDIAEFLVVDANPLRRLMEVAEATPDRAFVLDVVASLAYCQGVDPLWLLTGRYDPTLHRHVLSLGEERGGGLRRVREFVQEQFERLSRDTPPFPLPGTFESG